MSEVRRTPPAPPDTPITRASAAAVAATKPPRAIWITVVRGGEYIGVLLDADSARAIASDLIREADKLDPPRAKVN